MSKRRGIQVAALRERDLQERCPTHGATSSSSRYPVQFSVSHSHTILTYEPLFEIAQPMLFTFASSNEKRRF